MPYPYTFNFTDRALSIDSIGQSILNVNNIYINGWFSKDYTFSCQNCSLSVTINNITNFEICDYSFNYFDLEFRFTENHLQRIALANDSMESIGINVFRNLTRLLEIDLSNNKISRSNTFDITFQQLFVKNTFLTKIYLSNNARTYLPYDTFKSNRLLSLLGLSGNKFSQITFDMNFRLNLTLLDMRNNAIFALNSGSRNTLDVLYRTQQAAKVNKTFGVDLRGNNFSCECASLNFIEWFVYSPFIANTGC